MSEESLAEYTDRVLPRWWENPFYVALGSADGLDPVLLERFYYYARRSLELLDAVPRDDPFWQKTNMKATTYKAIIWFGHVLDADPGDTEARWILAALDMAQGGFPMGLLAWLVPEHPYILRWLVDLTVWTWEQSGADYSALLREELSTLQDVPAVRTLLEAPADNDELGRALDVARSVLAGNSIHMAVEGLTGQ